MIKSTELIYNMSYSGHFGFSTDTASNSQLENLKVKEKNRLNPAGINQDATGSTIVGNPMQFIA